MSEREKAYCKYHPKHLAGWFCPGCKTYFCISCAPTNENYPKCILCRKSLNSLSFAETIPPFKTKLSSLLLLPISRTPLMVILFFSLILSLLPNNKIGLLLLIICLLPLVEFLFDSMEQIACGEKLSIRKQSYFSFSNTNMFLMLLAVCFMCIFVIFKISVISPLVAQLMTVFFIIGLPASLVILMMEKSMLSMINPIKIGYIIKLFSSSYWIIFSCFALLAILLKQVFFHQLSFIQHFSIISLCLYLTLSAFIMAGYLVFLHHFELNFKIEHKALNQETVSKNTNKLTDVEVFIQEGRFEDAQSLLLDKIKKNPLDYKANEKLILLYAIQEKKHLLNLIAQKYFSDLVGSGKSKHAADFYCQLKSKMIAFSPDNINVITAITREMQNKSQFKYAINLIELFHKQEIDNWEDLYLIYAKLLAEFATRQQDAIKILNVIKQKSTNIGAIKLAEDYLSLIATFK